MKLKPIVNQFAKFLPFNTNFFTDVSQISSLIRVGEVATAVTTEPHLLSEGQVVVITGAVELVSIINISLDEDTQKVTVITAIDHGLNTGMNFKDLSLNLTVTLEGVTESEYNGEFKLLEVPNRTKFIFQLPFVPINPPTNTGFSLNFAANFFTGLKVVSSIISSTQFSYAISDAASTTTTGSILSHANWRISAAVNLERSIESYTKQQTDKYWLFVTPSSSAASKDRQILNDSVTTFRLTEDYRQRLIDGVSVYVFAPTANDLSGRLAVDNLEDVKVALFKTLLRFPTSSQYDADNNTGNQFVFYYNSSKLAFYNTSFIVFEYIFDANYDLTYNDTFNERLYTPFRNIGATSVINSQDFIWNVDLDVDP